MAIRIQLRRDTAANWVSSNPTLREGELGIETDTLKIKIGDGSAWNSISNYANVVPSDLSTTLGDYVVVSDIGAQGGVVGLNSSYNAIIPGSSIIIEGVTGDAYETTLTVTDPTADRTITFPDADGTVALTSNLNSYATLSGATFTGNINVPTAITFEGATADSYETTIQATDPTADRTIILPDAAGTVALTSDIPSTTDTLSEGTTNLYFTDERAQDAAYTALSNGTHTNISVSYNDSSNAISLTGAVTYTDENAQDAVGNAVGTGLSYNDSTGAISVDTTAIQTRVSDVSDTEIGYLNGVTSAIQTQIDGKLSLSGGTMTGTLTLSGAPTQASHAATKAYVDNTTAGLNFHAAAHCASVENLTATYDNGTGGVGATLTNTGTNEALTLDNHVLESGERVLIKDQTNQAENGIYVVTTVGDESTPWVLTRATDADNSPSGEVAYGDFTFVQQGTNGGYGYILTTTGTVTIGTTNIVYTVFNAGQTVIAGNGLSETTPGTLAINTGVTVDLNTAQTLTNKTITGTFTGNITGDVTGNVSGNAGTVTNGVYTNAANIITAATSSTNPLIIKGAASQSVDLQQWQDSSGTAIARIYSSGAARFTGTTQAPKLDIGDYNNSISGNYINVKGSSASTIGIIVRGASSQTANLQEWQNSSGTVLASISQLGAIRVSSSIGYVGGGGSQLVFQSGNNPAYFTATSTAGAYPSLVIKGIASQTADLQQWQNSSGTALASINSSGQFVGDGSQLTGIDGLPSQTGENGKYLTTDGTTASWASLVVPIETGTATLTANTATTISTTALSAFTSIEYMVSLKQGSKVRTSKVVVQTDGTSVDMTEFAITETGGTMTGVVVSATTSGSDAVLQATVTDATSTNVDVKFSKVKL